MKVYVAIIGDGSGDCVISVHKCLFTAKDALEDHCGLTLVRSLTTEETTFYRPLDNKNELEGNAFVRVFNLQD